MPTILHGDCLAELKRLNDNTIDAVVTDPPYSISFMAQNWDGPDTIAFQREIWSEVCRVLKPGGHLLAFSAPRTYHRLAVAIEDGGLEVRDQLAWIYGQGMPKTRNISKDLDRLAGAQREVVGTHRSPGYKRLGAEHGAQNVYTTEFKKLSDEPVTAEAVQWDGWQTALKPALEPICMARKPMAGSVAKNVLEHGVGALNIDACRVGDEERTFNSRGLKPGYQAWFDENARSVPTTVKGRYPSNVMHDGEAGITQPYFYCAKATAAEKYGSNHPCVKPLALMRHLVRLVTPPGGVVLDPFGGSGTTAEACVLEGFDVVICEREAEYIEDIKRRLGLAA